MLAVLLLNRMSMKRRIARKQKLSKPHKVEIELPEATVCRTCLSTSDLESIFVSKESEKKRSRELKLVTGLEIKMDDGLSQNICGKCKKTIKIALQFRRASRKANKSLLRINNQKDTKKYMFHEKVLRTVKEDIQDNDDDFNDDDNIQNDDYTDRGDDYDGNSFKIEYYPNENENESETCTVKQEDSEPIVKETRRTTGKKKTQGIPNAPPYKCNTCNKEFRMKATYKSHMRFHTNFCVCEACGKRCRNNNQLQEHKRARHGLGRIHKCAYCEYSAATKEALTIHERRHTGERPYVCDHCGATFHRRSNLVQHIAIHLPDKNFQCDMCPKRLKSRKFLQIHKHNAHTGKRYGYLCAVCDHRFEKPNKCNLCHQREKSKKRLQVHKYKMHTQKRYKYVCPVCRDVFARPRNVRLHLTRCHGVPRADQGDSIERLEIDSSVLPEFIGSKMFNYSNT